MSPLDSPVWNALTGPQRACGTANDLAACFDSDRSPFGAFCEEPGPEHWRAMAELIGPGGLAGPVGILGDPPRGWTQLWKGDGIQMVGDRFASSGDVPSVDTGGLSDVVDLGSGDVDQILALIAVAAPGPFERRTVEFGGYVGVRHGDQLVAMAGRRMHVPGAVEISAVATHPDFRRRGLAGNLVHQVARGILAEDAVPFLHASITNLGAIRLYEAMGFRRRRVITFRRVQAPT